MLYESASLELALSYGVATLRFRSTANWRDVADSIHNAALIVNGNPAIDVLVLRDFAVLTSPMKPTAMVARSGQHALTALEAMPIPTVAHIDGPCRGPALEIALACQWRTANGHVGTRLLWPDDEIPCWGGSVHLPRLIGRAQAIAMFTGALQPTGGQAYSIGLVDRVWSPKMAEVHLLALELDLQARPWVPSKLLRRWRRWRGPIRVEVNTEGTTLGTMIDRGLAFGAATGFVAERDEARRRALQSLSPPDVQVEHRLAG